MIGDLIGEWIKGILIDGIMGNLSGLFNAVQYQSRGNRGSDVGEYPAGLGTAAFFPCD